MTQAENKAEDSDSQNGGYVEANTGDSLPGRQRLSPPPGRYSPRETTLQCAAGSQPDTGLIRRGMLREGNIAAAGDQC